VLVNNGETIPFAATHHSRDELQVQVEVLALEPGHVPAHVAFGNVLWFLELSRDEPSTERTEASG
jgi:hypothetical protein